MSTMTADEMRAFQAVFQEAAATLPQRVLGGRQLVWKPGNFSVFKQQLRAAKFALVDEIRQAGLGGAVPDPRWQAAKPGSHTRRTTLAIGGHRQASASPSGWLADLASGAKKQAVHTDALALLQEGALSGLELAVMDPTQVAATGALGFKPDVAPEQAWAIGAIADMLRDSGVFDPNTVGMATDLANEIAGCLPILGAVTNLGSGVINGIRAGQRAWHVRKINELSVHVTPGNPMAALHATRTLLERKRTEYALIAAMDGSAGALQLTGMFVDLGAATGPALGITKAALKLAHGIFLALRNFREFRLANAALTGGGALNAQLIGDCPILGCYLISEAEHSTLMAFLAANALPPNWMDVVDTQRPHIETLVRLANQCQREAPFVLRGYEARFGQPGPVLKGEHFLDFRLIKGGQRAAHEANLILQRDPRGLRFFTRHLLARIGL